MNPDKYVAIEACKNRSVYRLKSRNLPCGVWRSEVNGFIGIREKFGRRYLFTEFHWDTGAPYGTAFPLDEIGVLPDKIELYESLNDIDEKTGRPVAFDKPKAEGGRGWFFKDTGEAGDIRAVYIENKDLFDFLDGVGIAGA
jgi:hypothetical protein